MALEEQITAVRKEIKPDGYDMSVGEIINLYRSNELVINPAYQRLFRWEAIQKTRFIESLLLGIPIPPIFVFQLESGVWELIDGLQRVSTILEFAGILRSVEDTDSSAEKSDEIESEDGSAPESHHPVRLLGTAFLPDLENKSWEDSSDGVVKGIGSVAQLYIRRARLRVEILRQEGSSAVKYELFQRLNTGGTQLSEQEVRNCTAIMIDPTFYDLLVTLAKEQSFIRTTAQTPTALKKQAGLELVLRFMAFRHVAYDGVLDVHEYLDKALVSIASNQDFDRAGEASIFRRTFSLLDRAIGSGTFKKWNGAEFSGKFLFSVFEVVAPGLSKNLEAVEAMAQSEADAFVLSKVQSLSQHGTFIQNSGAGVRGTTRLSHLLSLGEPLFRA